MTQKAYPTLIYLLILISCITIHPADQPNHEITPIIPAAATTHAPDNKTQSMPMPQKLTVTPEEEKEEIQTLTLFRRYTVDNGSLGPIIELNIDLRAVEKELRDALGTEEHT